MPAAARPGAGSGESRTAALAASALLATAVHAGLLFGIRIHVHDASAEQEVVEVALVASGEAAPTATPAAPVAAPGPPARPVERKPREPRPRAAAPTPAPEIAPKPAEAPATATGELTPGSEPAPTAPSSVAPLVGSGTPASATAATGEASARPKYRSNPAPPYPASARRRRQEGVVLLGVRVDASGRPEAIEVRVSSGFAALDAAAVAAVRGWEFEPGRVGGVPVPSQVEVPIHFELDRD
jgi:protein TonB